MKTKRFLDRIYNQEMEEIPPIHYDEHEEYLESILLTHGYSVSLKADLTESESHNILINLIKSKIISRVYVIGHFKYLICRNRNNSKFGHAIENWKDDLNYILNYGD